MHLKIRVDAHKNHINNSLSYLMEKIGNKELFGEIDPNEDIIHILSISHIIEDIIITDKKIVCSVKVLDTPSGKNIQELINHKFELYFIPRIVNNEVITFDFKSTLNKRDLRDVKLSDLLD